MNQETANGDTDTSQAVTALSPHYPSSWVRSDVTTHRPYRSDRKDRDKKGGKWQMGSTGRGVGTARYHKLIKL